MQHFAFYQPSSPTATESNQTMTAITVDQSTAEEVAASSAALLKIGEPLAQVPKLDPQTKALREGAKSTLYQAMDRFRNSSLTGVVSVYVVFENGRISSVDAETQIRPGGEAPAGETVAE